MRYWQRQCLRDAPPADRIAYAEDPAIAQALITQKLEYVSITSPGGSMAAGRLPRCWSRFGRGLVTSGAVLFVHERQSPSGERRLVVVSSDFNPRMSPPLFIIGYDLQVIALAPATWSRPMRYVPQPIRLSVTTSPPPIPPKLKIFAGQADPGDASHFTIRYEMYAQEGLLDGWLRDGGRIEVKVRTGPKPFPGVQPGHP